MSSNNSETPEGLDVQIATSEFDTEPVVADDEDEVIDIEFPSGVVFRRFARDIYEDASAGVREPVANAITAVDRAEELFDVDDGTVEITIYHSDGGDKQLVIRDSGIGMTKELIKEVLAVIGNSTSRGDGDVSGKFGMGFLACFMLVGFQDKASFIMHTRSRKTENQTSGIWRVPGKFEPKDNLSGSLADDEYGTKLVFPLKDDIAVSDVRNWVRTNVEWARKPVVYREIRNGDEVENDEYGFKTFEDDYDENAPVVEIDHDEFRAVASPDAQGRTILLDSPISGYPRTFDLPWSVDIRFKDENGVIVDGPNEGLTPVEDDEYDTLPEDVREDYIPESEVDMADVRLPEPTGTRDTLGSSREFWEWLDGKLYDLYTDEIVDLLDKFDDRFEFRDNLEEREQSLVADAVFYENDERVQTVADDQFDYEISDDLADEISIMAHEPKVVKRNSALGNNLHSRNSYSEPVWKIEQKLGDDGEVFMGVVLGSDAAQNKANVVWDDNENNIIVKLEKASDYATYEPLGWRKLKEIKKSSIDEFDVSEEVAAPFHTTSSSSSSSGSTNVNAGLDAPNRRIKVHYRSYGNPRDIYAEDIFEDFEDANEDGELPSICRNKANTLVLFPPNAERNISDNEWLVGGGVAAANSTKMVFDYLNQWDRVFHADEFIAEPSEKTVYTSHGELTLTEAVDTGQVVVQPMSAEAAALLRKQDEEAPTRGLLKRMATELAEGDRSFARSLRSDLEVPFNPEEDELVYAPVAKSDLDLLRGDLRRNRDDIHIMRGNKSYRVSGVSRARMGDEFNLYACARFPAWRDHDEFESLLNIGSSGSLHERLLSMADTLGMLHDKGIDPLSTELPPNRQPEPTFTTSEGTLTPVQAEEKADYAVFHVLPSETVDLFRDADLMPRLIEWVKQQSGGIGYSAGRDYGENDDDIVYIPVSLAEAQEAAQWLEGAMYYVYGDASTGGLSGDSTDIGSDVQAYAYARLSEWDDSAIMGELIGASLDLTDSGYWFVETLAELHDSGVDPADADDVFPDIDL